MKWTLRSVALAATLLACASNWTSALAQPARVFVAAQGSDSNACTFAAPCRTFQHAHDVVAANGEIDVLDPAGYGAVNINKAISIQGHGFSGVSFSGVNGVTINAGASDAVSLNGLLIEGSGVGANGIVFDSGKSLVVENCVIHGVTAVGLRFTSSASTTQTLAVSDSYLTDNHTNGMLIETTSSGAVAAAVDRVVLYGNGTGLLADGRNGTGALNVAVTDSVASNATSASNGFSLISAANQSIGNLVLTRITAANNHTGVAAAGANATVQLAQSTVTGNAFGYAAVSGGVMLSFGDNYITNNTSNSGSLGGATRQ